MKKLIRFLRVSLTRAVMRIFWIFPVRKKKIFFSAYEGKQYSCNPRAVFEKLAADPRFAGYRFVWELNRRETRAEVPVPGVRFVAHNSPAYLFAVMTSGVLLTNTGITCRFPLRKKQLSINTWHGGGAFKRVGFSIKSDLSGDLFELAVASKQTTWYLSSSRIFTDAMYGSVMLPRERFLPTGMPRNDLFFDKERCAALREKVLARFGLAPDDLLVLYAPTYRGAVGEDRSSGVPFDARRLCQTLERRFSRPARLMVRMHYYHAGAEESEQQVLSASDYPDMQELLAAADILITDYSSSIWDFALTGRLCLLYAPDLDQYDAERGFYMPPQRWPGLLCTREDELNEAVLSYDEGAYRQRVERYLADAGSYDKGGACERVIDLIREGGGASSRAGAPPDPHS